MSAGKDGDLLDGSSLLNFRYDNVHVLREGRVTFVSELFQLRLLCSVLQLFLISHSVVLLRLPLLPLSPEPASQSALPTRTHMHGHTLYTRSDTARRYTLPSAPVEIETHTTTGVYTRMSVCRGFGVIDELAEEMRRDRLRRARDAGELAEGQVPLQGAAGAPVRVA